MLYILLHVWEIYQTEENADQLVFSGPWYSFSLESYLSDFLPTSGNELPAIVSLPPICLLHCYQTGLPHCIVRTPGCWPLQAPSVAPCCSLRKPRLSSSTHFSHLKSFSFPHPVSSSLFLEGLFQLRDYNVPLWAHRMALPPLSPIRTLQM